MISSVIGRKEMGIHLKLTLKRRINNALLTIYLPTILILIIVYTTNFFKDFFFEAVVTVNLTSLLVLTTLFISVAQSLPPTAYVKMIDIWLIFAQMVPFLEVLLHSWMDTHRIDEDREINHHGSTIKVEDSSDMVGLHNRGIAKLIHSSDVNEPELIFNIVSFCFPLPLIYTRQPTKVLA